MTQLHVQQTYDLALQHHQAGRLQEAEQLYRQVLTQQPEHSGATHYLAVLAHQTGQLDIAIDLIRRAIALKPDYAEAYNNLGVVLKDKRQLDESLAAYRQAISLKPDYADAFYNLGISLKEANHLDDAIAAFRQAIALNPNSVDASFNLGIALNEKGDLDDAIAAYRQTIALKPDYVEAHFNLGNALKDKKQLDEAIAAYRQAIALRPNFPEAFNNLGNALKEQGHLDDAIAAIRQAIALRPDLPQAHGNLGAALQYQGQIDDAVAAFRKAVELGPHLPDLNSCLVYSLHFHPAYDARMIYDEHRLWNQRHAEPLRKFIHPHINDPDPDRRLRIGYVSPNFHEHPVGRFLLPLLSQHNHDRFAIVCYADVPRPDRLTALLRRQADEWKDIHGLTDEQLSQMIRQDQIDILIDLTMHMSGNRMLLFARKPAPVQATYLAYCSTTGLDAIDYRLTDPHLDPPGTGDAIYTEKSIPLPETYWCYPTHHNSPDPGPPPALSTGQITFGCLNNFSKVSPDALNLWLRLLQATPNSRLILHAQEGSHRQRLLDQLEHHGIDPSRLRFVDMLPLTDYFNLHKQINIALDPFPCNGGTTTLDAIWMGVPVITLKGHTAVGRAGVSIMSNLALPKLIADTPDQYLQIATALAADLPRLTELRRTLRGRMRASPLMNAPRFARNVEAAYRQMWRNWCQTRPAQP